MPKTQTDFSEDIVKTVDEKLMAESVESTIGEMPFQRSGSCC